MEQRGEVKCILKTVELRKCSKQSVFRKQGKKPNRMGRDTEKNEILLDVQIDELKH